MSRQITATAGLILLLAACTQSIGTTTTDVARPTTSTTLDEGGRVLETFDCQSAPEEVVIVCEAFDLINDHYVDEIDAGVLAEAVMEALGELDQGTSREALECPVPSAEFAAVCQTLAESDLTNAEAAEAVVRAMATSALDPNSAYFDSEALALLLEEQGGEIEGIGALVSPEDATLEGDDKQCSIISDTCRIVVASTIPGSPAEQAGLERDDIIVGVDGESILGLHVDEVTAMVRGRAGTDVTLTVDRDGAALDIPITRAAIVIPVITIDRFGDTGYVQLQVFSDNADEQFEDAVLGLLADGVENLVVDLRDNPGGLLDTAVEVASAFLQDGGVVVTEGPDERTVYEVSGRPVIPAAIPVVIVVNQGSASASEVVSAVLQERGRATVVGENTFGKNTVQQRYSLSNGGALKLTVARWLTPEGLDFGGVGVTPDVAITLDPEITTEALVALLADL